MTYAELFEVSKKYPTRNGDYVVVEHFSLRMQKGEVVSLIGHSGCGKSTVLSMIAGLTTLSGGDIVVAGQRVYGPGPDRAVVFQAPCLLPWLSAYENVKLGVDSVFARSSVKERAEMTERTLGLVGLRDAMHKFPRELSSGMRQRVGIARALAIRPKLLLLDEPFGMLDSLTRMELQEVLLSIVEREEITTLVVTHDVDEALFLSDRVVMMTSGPRARVGQILGVNFERPRRRTQVVEHRDYYHLREELILFLAEQEPQGTAKSGRAA
ncbi:MAG TPA: ABC transporter ATP-binding protein [Polyangiaceae bacterium]|nr:ABC transporter ATP-binding protein [Polyangiaceae bacterium]